MDFDPDKCLLSRRQPSSSLTCQEALISLRGCCTKWQGTKTTLLFSTMRISIFNYSIIQSFICHCLFPWHGTKMGITIQDPLWIYATFESRDGAIPRDYVVKQPTEIFGFGEASPGNHLFHIIDAHTSTICWWRDILFKSTNSCPPSIISASKFYGGARKYI